MKDEYSGYHEQYYLCYKCLKNSEYKAGDPVTNKKDYFISSIKKTQRCEYLA